jgi:prefoldin subunit 5
MADANKNQREIIIDDKLLTSMVVQKGEMVEQGRAIAKQMQELTEQMERLQKQMAPLTEKVIKHKRSIFDRLKKLVGRDLTEFEIPVNADIREGKVVLLVEDSLSVFKDAFMAIDKFKEPVPLKK